MLQTTAEPKEIEQRWLVANHEGAKLSQQNISASLIIQGFIGETAFDGTRISKVSRHIVIDEDVNPRIAKLLISFEPKTQMLSIDIPPEHAKQLEKDEGKLLNNIRIRLKKNLATNQTRCFLTIKGEKQAGEGLEYEYDIPTEDGLRLLRTLCRNKLIGKVRYDLADGVELDYFPARDIYIAEREVKNKSQMLTKLPEWAQRDITQNTSENRQYTNYNLAGVDNVALQILAHMAEQLSVGHSKN